MPRFITIIFVLFFSKTIFSQAYNLIPNASFEFADPYAGSGFDDMGDDGTGVICWADANEYINYLLRDTFPYGPWCYSYCSHQAYRWGEKIFETDK